MGINKKLIGCLLCGGAVIGLVSYAGVEIDKKVKYKKKIEVLRKIAKDFANKPPQEMEGWWLADYENDRIWSLQYHNIAIKGGNDGKESKILKEKWPTVKIFKDYCYEEARKGWSHLHSSNGFVAECARGPNWAK